MTDTKLLSESMLIPFTTSVPRADFEDLRSLEFDVPMPRAARSSSLGFRVSVIRQVCAQEEVIGSNANAVVAGMTDEQTIRYWAIVEYPREAVGITASEYTVSIRIRTARPDPAFAGRIDLVPEPSDR